MAEVVDAPDEGFARSPERLAAQQVIVREVGMDDVVVRGERAHAGDCRPHVTERPFLGEDGTAPINAAQTVLEVASRPVGEHALDPSGTERLRELEGRSGGACPAVRGDEVQHAHRCNTSRQGS